MKTEYNHGESDLNPDGGVSLGALHSHHPKLPPEGATSRQQPESDSPARTGGKSPLHLYIEVRG